MRLLPVIVTLAAIVCQSLAGMAQTDFPYQLKSSRELIIIGAGAGLAGYALYQEQNATPILNASDIIKLDKNDVFAFDRSATENWSEGAHRASDIVGFGSLGLTALVGLALPVERGQKVQLGLMYFEALALNGGLTLAVKNTTFRLRPYMYGDALTIGEKLERGSNNFQSFWSGHTSTAASASFFGARVFTDLYPKSKWKPWIWTGAGVLTATTGYLRVKAGRHFATDVIAGGISGAAIGYLIPVIHRSPNVELSVLPSLSRDQKASFYLVYRF